jgi:PKD repeat protein
MKKILLIPALLSILILFSCQKKPQACFTYQILPDGHNVEFENCSTNADHYLWEWQVGDHFIYEQTENPGRTYFASGTINISLTSYSATEKYSDVTSKTIEIN